MGKLLLKSFFRKRVIQLRSIYTLALSEMSKTLNETPKPDVALSGEVELLRKRLPDATAILEKSSGSSFRVENPVQTMKLLSHTLNTGLDRSLGSSARMLQLLDKVMAEESIPAEQKTRLFDSLLPPIWSTSWPR